VPFLRRLSFSLVSSVLLGSLCWGIPSLAQPTQSEQLQSAVEEGQWQQAIDLIDQIIAADPSRQESLVPFREKYSQRLAIDQQLSQGNWRQASALLDQFIETYAEDGQALKDFQTQLKNLAEVQTLAEEGDRVSALARARTLQESSPALASLMQRYEQQILAGVPRVGEPVQTPDYTLTVTQFQDVTRQVNPESEQQQYLVRMMVQNTGAGTLTLGTDQGRGFPLFVQGDRTFEVGRDAAGVLTDDPRLEPINTPVPPGGVLQTGLIYGLEDLPQPLYFSFAGGRLVRLR